MASFRTLDLAIEFFDLVEKIELKGNLKDQLNRAASSIALNLAEGNAKGSVKEKKRFYHTAYGSVKECRTILLLAKIEDRKLNALADHLGASIYKLMMSEITSVIRAPV